MKFTLADLLLRRKELAGKVNALSQIRLPALFEVKTVRKNVADNIDELTLQIPKLAASQVTAEFDHFARKLRLIDAVIQRTNWTTEIEMDGDIMLDFAESQAAKNEDKSAAK